MVRWQIVGFAFTSLIGVLLHFLYDWLGQSPLVAPIAAVNESVWEHMKLLYWPLVLFAVIEGRFLTRNFPSFWCAKLVSTLTGVLVIPLLYYTYTGALGTSADWFNITIFFIAAALTYLLDTHLLTYALPCRHPKVALGILLAVGVLLAALTFWTPQIPLFRDPIDGTYGI